MERQEINPTGKYGEASAPPMMPYQGSVTSSQIPQLSQTPQTRMILSEMRERILNLEKVVGMLQKKVMDQEVEIRKLTGKSSPSSTKKEKKDDFGEPERKSRVYKKVMIYDYSGNCLDIQSEKTGEKLIAWEVRRADSQYFYVVEAHETQEWMHIGSGASRSKCLQDGTTGNDGKPCVVQADKMLEGDFGQHWRFVRIGGGEYFGIQGRLSSKFLRSDGLGCDISMDEKCDKPQNRFRIV